MHEPAALAGHVQDLAAAFRVVLVVSADLKPEQASAQQMTETPTGPVIARMVVIHPVVDETTYAVALHELGHCVDVCGSLHAEKSRRTPGTTSHQQICIAEETAAWAWAQHYAMVWTPPMQSVMDWAMGSYQTGASQIATREAEVVERQRTQGEWTRRHRVDDAAAFAARIRGSMKLG